MGLRDWIARRRTGGTAGGGAGGEEAGTGGAAPRRPVAGDGGWREVAPLVPTLAGTAHGVSDGLRFRSRLAAWQDPSLCGPLGHAVLPSAPAGILRAVAAPGSPSTIVAGGEELVLPVVTGAAGAQEPGEPGEARPVQRSVGVRRLPVRPGRRPARAGAADRRAVPDGSDGGVSMPAAPMSGVAKPAASTPGVPMPDAPTSGVSTSGVSTSGVATDGAPRPGAPTPVATTSAAATRGVPTPVAAAPDAVAAAPRRSDAVGRAYRPVRPRSVGEPLTVARRPRSLPPRPVAAVPGPGRTPDAVDEPPSQGTDAPQPVVTAEEPAGGMRPAVTGEAAVRTAPGPGGAAAPARNWQAEGVVQRAAVPGAAAPTRPVLGAPLTALPASASRVAATGPQAPDTALSAPAMPLVPADAGSTGPEAGGLDGARRSGNGGHDATSGPRTRTVAGPGGPAVSRPERGPAGGAPVQRTPSGAASASHTPSSAAHERTGRVPPDPVPARTRGGLGAPLDALPPTAAAPGGTAPLLGGHRPVRRIVGPAAGDAAGRSAGSAAEQGAPSVAASAVGEGPRVQRSARHPGDGPTESTARPRRNDDGRSAGRNGPADGGRGAHAGAERGRSGPAAGSAAVSDTPSPSTGTGTAGGPTVRPIGTGSERRPGTARQPIAPAARPSHAGAPDRVGAPLGSGGGPAVPVTVPVRPAVGGSGVQRAVELTGPRRGLLGERRMTVALAAPSASSVTSTGAPAGTGAAPAPPVVPAVWPNALAPRTDGQPAAESAAGAPQRSPGAGDGRTATGQSAAQASPVRLRAPGAAAMPGRSSGTDADRGVVAAAQRSRSRRSSDRGDGRATADHPLAQRSSVPPGATPIAAAPADPPRALPGHPRAAVPNVSALLLPGARRPQRGATSAGHPAPRSAAAPTSAGRSGPGAPGSPSATAAALRPPVVRLAPLAAPSLQQLPAASRLPQPSPAQPPTIAGRPGSGRAPGLQPPTAPSPVVSRTVPAARPPSAPPAPPSPGTARLLQRVAEQAGLSGVPLTAVPARTPITVQAAPPTAPPSRAASPSQAAPPPAEPAGGGPADLDELARRLVEPVGRLLRTELRRGRERSGKPYDMRR